MSWSTSKGVVATAAHRLVDRGELDVDAPVAEYWPEFKAAGKEDVRVANLLDHSAGMHSVRGVIENAEMLFQWDRTVDALAAAAPKYQPGTKHGYHALTYGFLVGEVLRRVTGLSSVNAVVQREIVEPLGLEGMTIGATGEVAREGRDADPVVAGPGQGRSLHRAAGPARLAPARDRRVHARRATSPAPSPRARCTTPRSRRSTAVFTARSLAQMYSAIAMGGTLDGVKFLSPETIARAGTVRTRAARHRDRLADAVAARVPHGRDDPWCAAPRLRSLRPRRLGRVGRSGPRAVGRDDLQPDGRDPVRRPAAPAGRVPRR